MLPEEGWSLLTHAGLESRPAGPRFMVCVLELSSFSSCETSYEKDLENENPLGKDPVDHRLLPVAVLLRLTRRKYNLSYRIFQRTREWVWLAVVQVPCASPAWLVWKCQSCRRGEGVNSAVSLNHFLLSQRLPQPLCSRLHTCLLPGHPGVAEMRPSTLEFSGLLQRLRTLPHTTLEWPGSGQWPRV